MHTITVNFRNTRGKIGMLHGMNNGPYMHQGDFGQEYDEIGVPFVRFHETHSPSTKCIEIPFIFRDFDADENDPASYFFDITDKVISEAVRHGITVMYRLGMGTEATRPQIFCKPPADFDKWARICTNIVRHYNDGWANGFHFGIEYWEIWNEPDLKEYWSGTVEEYISLYEKTARAIKAYDKSMKVGAFSVAGVVSHGLGEFGEAFFRYVTEHDVPIDFFSWHFYSELFDKIELKSRASRDIIRKWGYEGKIENINSEWHGVGLHGEAQKWDLSDTKRVCSAVCNVGAMIIMHRYGVTKAAYYDPENRGSLCGIWDVHMKKQKQFYGFKAFGELYRAETECESTTTAEGMQVLAAHNGQKAVLLIANQSAQGGEYLLDLKGFPPCDMRVSVLDETRDLEKADSDSFGEADSVKRIIDIPRQSVVLVEFLYR